MKSNLESIARVRGPANGYRTTVRCVGRIGGTYEGALYKVSPLPSVDESPRQEPPS